jgi:hypothetical protein
MRIFRFPSLLIVAALLLAGAAASPGAGIPPDATLGDTFSLVPGHREAGSSLLGQLAEVGGATWTGVGKPVITSDGDVSVADTEPAMGLLPLPKPDAAIDLSGDLKPGGSGFIALALLPNDSPGDFWQTAAVYVLLSGNGDYQILAHGADKLLKKGPAADYTFDPNGFNHVELLCDPATKTVSVKANGTVIFPATVIADLPDLVCAAFRFNEKVTPNVPRLDNFAVTPVAAKLSLNPRSSSQFFVEPVRPATLGWRCAPAGAGGVREAIVRNYSGQEVSRLPVTSPAAGVEEVAVKLPQGYYTLSFPETGQEFGLVVQPARADQPDFFLESTRLCRSWSRRTGART